MEKKVRVLFYYDNFCSSRSKGGTEVATYRIAKALTQTGRILTFNAFRNKTKLKEYEPYQSTIRLNKIPGNFINELSFFIDENEIDMVVNMGRFFRNKLLHKAILNSSRKPKLFFMQHFAPGSEMKKGTWRAGLHLLKLNPRNPIYWLRASVYPLLKLPRRLNYRKIYKEVYDRSEKIILLSEGYSKDYCNIAGIENQLKFFAIPNIVENSDHNSPDIIENKGKSVLILSRMDEVQKRLSLALKIWRRIEESGEFPEWTLDIVGSGHNEDIVKKLIKELNLQQVRMHGWQPREEYLKRAGVLISTSEYEGLPLSILEAQAYGCTPIAFNSYASLKDVIKNGDNGIVVENFGDIEEFADKLSELMRNNESRKRMAMRALSNIDNYSSDKIARQWLKILT